MMIKAIIADDEEKLRKSLKSKILNLWPDLDFCGEAENGRQALELIRSVKPDVVFLDIKMPGFTGIEVANKVEKSCLVVFITAYEGYAVEAFENEAIDYLLKPINEERLKKTIARIQKKLSAPSAAPVDIGGVVERVIKEMERKSEQKFLTWLKVQSGGNIKVYHINDIYFFQADQKYTTVFTENGESLIKKPIKELVEELDPELFWQIHRSTIINVKRIEKVSPSLTGKYIVKLKGVTELFKVSRTFVHLFKIM